MLEIPLMRRSQERAGTLDLNFDKYVKILWYHAAATMSIQAILHFWLHFTSNKTSRFYVS